MEEHRARKETSTSCKKEADDLVHVLLNLQDLGDLEIPLTDSTIKAVILVSILVLVFFFLFFLYSFICKCITK